MKPSKQLVQCWITMYFRYVHRENWSKSTVFLRPICYNLLFPRFRWIFFFWNSPRESSRCKAQETKNLKSIFFDSFFWYDHGVHSFTSWLSSAPRATEQELVRFSKYVRRERAKYCVKRRHYTALSKESILLLYVRSVELEKHETTSTVLSFR